jgi:chlorobactene glucosyltransferase
MENSIYWRFVYYRSSRSHLLLNAPSSRRSHYTNVLAMTLLVIFCWAFIMAWLVAAVMTLYCLARQKFLKPPHDARLLTADAPLVSILVPARNEAHRILADSMRSILAQDYRRFEVIAIDDRSTDSTPYILRDLAADHDQLKLITGAELPVGWLGKPWALQQAIESARGEWILATDADMIFEPTALRAAMSEALAANYDALTLIPRFEAHSFWERVFIPTWLWRLLILFVLGGLNDPRARQAKAMGGFILMRRAVLERLGGFSAVKAEVVEDVRLAELLKREGALVRIEYAPHLLRTRMYSDFNDLWENCSRNWFALVNFSLLLTLVLIAGTLAVAVLPALLAGGCGVLMILNGAPETEQLFMLAAAMWGIQAFLLALVSWRHGIQPVYALTTPLGFALQCALLLNSAFKIKLGNGVTWKGRKIYEPLDDSVSTR